jgi:2-polyprenyl-3-methyl-5-hydroxy-6-metoxy-1,4-benzoquinol methylase
VRIVESETDAAAFLAFEKAGWQRKASASTQHAEPVSGKLIQPLLDAAEVTDGTRLLDVACGPGWLAAAAAGRGATATGVDISEAMVELAHARYPEAEFRGG